MQRIIDECNRCQALCNRCKAKDPFSSLRWDFKREDKEKILIYTDRDEYMRNSPNSWSQ